MKDIDFDIESYKEYTVTNEKKVFLQCDNKNRENRFLVFMSQFGIDWLRESLRNHSDGTFDSSPKLFFRFYVVFGQKNSMILDCVYASLPNKTTESYVEMLNAVKKIVKPLGDIRNLLPYAPSTALTDFEKAIQNA